MGLGRRPGEGREMWVASTELPKSKGHVWYWGLDEILDEAGFNVWLEKLSRPSYHDRLGRPSIPPGRVLPDMLRELLRGDRFAAGNCLAVWRQAFVASVFGNSVVAGEARPFEPEAGMGFLSLVDRSGSMGEPFGPEPGRKKADGIADAINRLMLAVLLCCAEGERVRDYFHIGVIGYRNADERKGSAHALRERRVRDRYQ